MKYIALCLILLLGCKSPEVSKNKVSLVILENLEVTLVPKSVYPQLNVVILSHEDSLCRQQCERITIAPSTYNYPYSDLLDYRLRVLLKIGIVSYSEAEFSATVTFRNGTEYRFWNEGKYYAWLSEGVFTYPSGMSFSYANLRPSVEAMEILLRMITYYQLLEINRESR